MKDDWEARRRVWDEAGRKADVPYYITNKDNPLRQLAEPRENAYEYNMRVLERDLHQREKPVTGKIYAGIMDNMRYNGGNE